MHDRQTRSTVGTLAAVLLAFAWVAGTTVSQTDPAANWDRVFAKRPILPVGGDEFVARCADRLLQEGLLEEGSKALVLAMGDGRNAVHLAQKEFAVTGVDISEVAIEKARKIAAEAGVEIATVQADLSRYDMGTNRWDLVTNIYFNPAIRIFDRIKRSVRPGGFLLVEGFGADHRGEGPPQWSRYRANELIDKLEGWRILEYQDGMFPTLWARGGKVPVVRVLARKPNRAD